MSTPQTRLTDTLPPNTHFAEVRMYRTTKPPFARRAIVFVTTPEFGMLCACALDLDDHALVVSAGGQG